MKEWKESKLPIKLIKLRMVNKSIKDDMDLWTAWTSSKVNL